MSITRVRELMKRIVELDRPARIFYLSDFDPGGISMPMSVARKAEYAVRCDHPGLDLQVVPLAMSREQVAQYGLPTIPIKETEVRADKFMERQEVDGAVELDALEALHPGELAEIVTEAIRPFRLADSAWSEDLESLDNRLTRQADSREHRVPSSRYGDELDELENEFQQICNNVASAESFLRTCRFSSKNRSLNGSQKPSPFTTRPGATSRRIVRSLILTTSQRLI